MEKISKYAKYIYEEQDKDLIDILDSYLSENAERIYDFFDSNLPRQMVEIRIIPTKEEYDKLIMARRKVDSVPNWSIGCSYDDIIEYLSINDYKNTSHAFSPEEYDVNLEYFKKTIVHEYVHFVVRMFCGKNYPILYLNEGIAQYLSGQREHSREIFKASIEDLYDFKSCYMEAYLMTKYILEEYGKDYFMKLFLDRELAKNETPKIFEEVDNLYNPKNKKL